MRASTVETLPLPGQQIFNTTEEQSAYFNGVIAGQAAANILISDLYAQEYCAARISFKTGLPNEVALKERLEAITSSATEGDYALLWADGDNFKAINDKISHDRGDEVLAETGDAISKAVRTNGKDHVYHISGDEFVALIFIGDQGNYQRHAHKVNDAELDDVRRRIDERMREVLKRNRDVETLGYGLSTGIAYPRNGLSLKELKLEAEREMQLAKDKNHEVRGQHRKA